MYKKKILLEEEKFVNPNHPNKDEILTTKQKLKLKMLDQQLAKERDEALEEAEKFNPEQVYIDQLQDIYKKNMQNIITKPVIVKESTQLQNDLFKVTKDN